MNTTNNDNNLRFSQRKGYTPVREKVQKESFDKETQNKLWDIMAYYLSMEMGFDSNHRYIYKNIPCFVRIIYSDILKMPMDMIPKMYEEIPILIESVGDYAINHKMNNDIYSEIKDWFFHNPFHTQLDIIEKFVQSFNELDSVDRFNTTFKELLVGYRITEFGKVIDIDNEEEYKAIDQAARETSHIEKATQLLYDRKNPDYANSIKESISAVEEVCRDITGDESATLSGCLDYIEEHIQLHNAFKDALQKLYGWTCDEGGIRHSSTKYKGKMDVNFETAKFMLVTCSAFVNYLKEKQIQIKSDI